jgi:glycosyltransferase involved in cell wall biosynthesis
MHLIAHGLKRKLNIPWLADFRDPWTEVDYYDDLMVGKRAHSKNLRLEKSCFDGADQVIAATPGMERSFRKKYPQARIKSILNGFDSSDYEFKTPKEDNKQFTLVHSGTMGPSRNPAKFWSALKRFVDLEADRQKRFTIRLIGRIDHTVKKAVDAHGLSGIMDYISYVPHNELIKELSKADAFLLIVNQAKNAKAILTGKVFEYLALEKPILAIGPEDSDIHNLLVSTNSGMVRNWDDEDGIVDAIRILTDQKTEGFTFDGRSKYERKNLTQDLSNLLTEVVNL